jgi:hypothetical protein
MSTSNTSGNYYARVEDLPDTLFRRESPGRLTPEAEMAVNKARGLSPDQVFIMEGCSEREANAIRSAIDAAKKRKELPKNFKVSERIERDPTTERVTLPKRWTVYLVNYGVGSGHAEEYSRRFGSYPRRFGKNDRDA